MVPGRAERNEARRGRPAGVDRIVKRVAIFRTDLLPLSETFIGEQAGALQSWRPVLVGRREVKDGLRLPAIAREVVPASRSRIVRALRLWLCLADPRLVRRLEALQVDLVHAHFGPDATDIWPSVRSAGLPMVVTLHGYDVNIDRRWWEAGGAGLRMRVYPRQLLRMARDPAVRFIAVSEAIRGRAVALGIPAEKVSVASIGADTRKFRPEGAPVVQRGRRILFVGRMVEKKAPLLLIQAFAVLRQQVPDAALAMIGDGPLLPAAKELAHELALPVSFLGARPSSEVLAQLQQAAVFCLPSATALNGDAEGLPISLLEAQACGVPCVTTRHSGNPEALDDGRSGKVVPENDVAALAAALRDALTDSAWQESASAQARAHALERFSLARCSEALERIYDEHVARRDTSDWRQVERFDPAWRERIRRMASLIGEQDTSVVDVGCGPMWLRSYLPAAVRYLGVDYVDRGEGTVVCDLNAGPLPELPADVWFVSGCLEYVEDPKRFIAHAARNARACILSYCDFGNFPSMRERRKRGWKNHLTLDQLRELFAGAGMRQTHSEILPSSRNAVLVFRH